MLQEWYVAIPPLLVAVVALVVPGLLVLLAGWGWSRPALLLAAPAVSTAILAVAATAAPVVGLGWSAVPAALLTLVAAAAAYGLRRWVGTADTGLAARDLATRALGPGAALITAILIVGAQLVWSFGRPENISQTFDAIVHLNTAAFAVDTANASAFHIGATSDIPFYPNAWHSLVALVATTTGVGIPVAVTAANLAIGAVAWPMSCLALAAAFFPGRRTALVIAAALSTGFGAFPLLLFFFGVLYPNVAAYAILPAGVAIVVWLLRAPSVRDVVRWTVLLGVVCAGIGLAHPNAFLALYAFGAALAVAELLRRALRDRTRRTWVLNATGGLAIVAVGAAIWRFSRTNSEMSQWAPWQATAQSIGEAVLLNPRQYPLTVVTALLIIAGLISLARRPRLYPIAIPYVVAAVFFVLASGSSAGNVLRELITNPWYNDSYRLAALLPVAGIPVATLGGVAIADLVRSLAVRRRAPRAVVGVAAAVGVVAVFSVGVGPNVARVAVDARGAYVMTSASLLLTTEEQTLLERLDQTTPPDALIAGSPWTGTSLAYAIADREVVEKHIFGARDDDEVYLDENLRNIDSDPRVCDAIRAVGVDYVLDFGAQNVWNNPAASVNRDGIQDLPPTRSLELVDSEGPDAKLYRVVGCGG